MQLVFTLLLFSTNAFAFLNQTCNANLADYDQPEIDILFHFKNINSEKQILDIQVFRNGALSVSESEFFDSLSLTKNYPSEGRIKIISPDSRLRIFTEEYRHPATGELQLPHQGYIRWVSPITVPMESVVRVTCPLS